jgi:uncharacterized sodium:solute symporter family permease YidK
MAIRHLTFKKRRYPKPVPQCILSVDLLLRYAVCVEATVLLFGALAAASILGKCVAEFQVPREVEMPDYAMSPPGI